MSTPEELDPEIRAIANFPILDLDDNTVAVAREYMSKALPASIEVPGVDIKLHKVAGPKDAPEVEVYTLIPNPAPTSKVPVLLWIHGGAYIIGDAKMDHLRMASIVKELGIIVVSTNYRLAPENPFPAAIEDCYAALSWMHSSADELGIDVNKIAVGGHSSGGGLTASLAILARDRGEFKIAFQILDSPMLDNQISHRKHHPKQGNYITRLEHIDNGWKCLLGKDFDSAEVSPYASAARAKSFAGLPSAYIHVGEYDLFREESIAYAQSLWSAGVSVELNVVPRAVHAYHVIADATITKRLDEHVQYVLRRELITKN